MQKLGVFWKIQVICYQMGTEIIKIEEEMTEKLKPQVAIAPSKNKKWAEFTAHNMHSFDVPLHFHELFQFYTGIAWCVKFKDPKEWQRGPSLKKWLSGSMNVYYEWRILSISLYLSAESELPQLIKLASQK